MTDLITSVLAGGLYLATPLLLTALGEVFVERSGILNLATEGMMLIGAFAAYWGAVVYGNLWVGVLVGMVTGLLTGILMGVFCIRFRANQIVTGIAISLLAIGLTTFLNDSIFGVRPPPIPQFEGINIPGLSDIPYVGPILFSQNVLTYISLILVPITGVVLYRTAFGLRVRAVGENPEAADSLGVNVFRSRYICLLIGGLFAGVGGAFYTLSYLGRFTNNMSAGRGWIAVVIVILGRWSPYGALGGSLLFGSLDVLQYDLQTSQNIIPYQFLLMIPYVVAMVLLAIATKLAKKRKPPAALTIPYKRKG